MKDTSECLPCPVCGANNEYFYMDNFEGKFQIICTGCQSAAKSNIDPQKAVHFWNMIIQRENGFNNEAIKLRKEYLRNS